MRLTRKVRLVPVAVAVASVALVLDMTMSAVEADESASISPSTRAIETGNAAGVRMAQAKPRRWRPLLRDGIHDRANPGLKFLQEPTEALSELPAAEQGNQVDWVKALRDGFINPRTNIYPETKIQVIDLDIIMPETAGMPAVKFPHRAHTEWLDCENCHDKIFPRKAGATPVNMYEILQGEYCGQCHGAVSFPLTQCRRCHSVPKPAESKPAPSGADLGPKKP
jgi:c(7)-type cytochrome triheme protein